MKKQRKRKPIPARAAAGIAVGAPGAPREGSDAGDASDLGRAYLVRQVRTYRTEARRLFAETQRLAVIANTARERQAAEGSARAALEHIVKAFWWAEDTDMEDKQHALMHEIGRWTRETFGCHLQFDGVSYSETCPIQMAHRRMGLSPAFVGARVCAICEEDLSECEHIRGRSYWVRGERNSDGRCRVCFQPDCHHRPDRLYRASVRAIITRITEVREVSLVSRPAQPEARLTRVSVSTEGLAQALGTAFRVGVPVSCDKCLGGCWGFAQLGDG